jgi:hypothetical protein
MFLAVLLSTALFALITAGTHLPLMADDYSWLAIPLKNPGFTITDLYIFARMPVTAGVMTGVLKSGWLENYPMSYVTLMFAVHATAFALLLRSFKAALPLSIYLIAAVLFAFQPGNYEIHLWHLNSSFSIGALLVAISASIQSRKLWPIQVLGFSLAMLTYDTYPLMILGVVGLSWILKRGDWKRLAIAAVTAFAIDVAVKMIIGHAVGFLHAPPAEHSPLVIISHFKTVLRMLGLIHFYKADWPLTLVEWTAIGILVTAILRRRLMNPRQLALLFALPFAAALPLSLMVYSAERAYFGPQLIRGVVLAILLSTVLMTWETRRWAVSAIVLFSIAYFGQWAYILHSKRQNEAILEAQESRLVAQMSACTSPCMLEVPAPDTGLTKDYIVTVAFWPAYFERIHYKYFPQKDIHFECKDAGKIF